MRRRLFAILCARNGCDAHGNAEQECRLRRLGWRVYRHCDLLGHDERDTERDCGVLQQLAAAYNIAFSIPAAPASSNQLVRASHRRLTDGQAKWGDRAIEAIGSEQPRRPEEDEQPPDLTWAWRRSDSQARRIRFFPSIHRRVLGARPTPYIVLPDQGRVPSYPALGCRVRNLLCTSPSSPPPVPDCRRP